MGPLITLSLLFLTHIKSQRIAICTGGQAFRLIPELLIKNLLVANPKYSFHHFYNLQRDQGNGPIFYKQPVALAAPSSYAGLNEAQIRQRLRRQLKLVNSKVESITFYDTLSSSEWQNLLNVSRLDRFRGIAVDYQDKVLNMYASHPMCMKQILQF